MILSYLFHIVVSQGFIYLIFSLVLWLIWYKAYRQTYLLFWAFGFLFGALGWVINLVPTHVFGSETLFWLIDILITLISVSGVTYGLALRSKRAWKIIWFVFAGFIAVHWIVYFSSIQINFALKMAISPWFIAICMQLNAYIVWQKSGALTFIEKVVAIICQVSAFIHALRGMLLVEQPLTTDQNITSTYDIVSYLVLPINFTAIGIALLLLVIADFTQRLKTTSIVDQQTNFLNRLGIADISEKLMANCQRDKQPISLILIDIDHFQSIKQQFGAKIGQKALDIFTKTITEILHKGDFIGQIQEHRFVVVLPNTNEANTLKLAERLRLAVGQISFQNRSENIRLTASLGVLSSRTIYCYHSLMRKAEQALSQAERVERNRVVNLL